MPNLGLLIKLDKREKILDSVPELERRIKALEGLVDGLISNAVEQADAPVTTVGDSYSVPKYLTHKPCPSCEGRGYEFESEKQGINCIHCNGMGWVLTDKSENLTPSPNPSRG